MPRIGDLLAPSKTVKIETSGGPVLAVDYQPGAVTVEQSMLIAAAQAAGDELALTRAVVAALDEAVIGWDLTGNDGQPWPPDAEHIVKLAGPVLIWIFQAIQRDVSPAADAGESLPSAAG